MNVQCIKREKGNALKDGVEKSKSERQGENGLEEGKKKRSPHFQQSEWRARVRDFFARLESLQQAAKQKNISQKIYLKTCPLYNLHQFGPKLTSTCGIKKMQNNFATKRSFNWAFNCFQINFIK